ncbi:hypothetical protein ACFR9U_04740 [Halorientalis brevis]|uniref:Uncharacterized protein n=1 Tax=Halorientalis brevis TaxID=1126241 RepID=A0ABD6C978_9EURY|nr:hypothetical protein [Halorientalis brevis]
MDAHRSRRDVLRSGTAIAGMAGLTSLAGCSDIVDSVVGSSGQLGPVPDDVDVAVQADTDALRNDSGLRSVVNAWLEVQARDGTDEPRTVEDLLGRFEEETGVDPSTVSSVTPFLRWNGLYGFYNLRGFGSLVTIDADAEDVVDGLAAVSTWSYDEDEHYGQPIYRPDTQYRLSIWVGVLDAEAGRYVVGAEGAVKNAIEAQIGEAEALDGTLADAFSTTRSAPVRFVADVPLAYVPEALNQRTDAETIQLEPLNEVSTVSGAVYRDGDERGIEATFAADDDDTAANLVEMLEAVLDFTATEASTDAVATVLEDSSITQNGADVVVTYENSTDELADLASELASPAPRRRETPMAKFTFEYEGGETNVGTVTITHDGGDTIRRDELSIRGEGFAPIPDVDMTGPGEWQGSASGEIDDGPAVVAGDHVTIGAESDYDFSVVWESEDGEMSATLAADTGPAEL